jgi:hypothetical protein
VATAIGTGRIHVLTASATPTAREHGRIAYDRLRPKRHLLLGLQNGIPSRDYLRRVLSVLKPETFQTCLQSLMMTLVSEGDDVRPTIAIDGKVKRRSCG